MAVRFLFSAILFFNNLSIAQERTRVLYEHNCEGEYWCIDCGSPKASWADKFTLTDYFIEKLDSLKIAKVRGVISVSIIVYEDGHVCCQTLSNHTHNPHGDILNLEIDKAVNSMPKWNPAIKDGKPFNAIVIVNLYSNVKGRGVFEAEIQRVNNLIIDE